MGKHNRVIYPDRKEMVNRGEKADMAVYAQPGTGSHLAVTAEIMEVTKGKDVTVYLFGDKRTLSLLYENLETISAVKFLDITALKETEIVADGKTAWVYIDLYNVPETEHAKEALLAFLAGVKEKKDVITTCICNRVSEGTVKFARDAAFIRCHSMDLDSINKFTDMIPPALSPRSLRYHIRKYYFIKSLLGKYNTYLLGTKTETGSFKFKKRTIHYKEMQKIL